MASGNSGPPLSPARWRRVCAVLDRLNDLDSDNLRAALPDACRAEGLTVDEVASFLAADACGSQLPGHLTPQLVANILESALTERELPAIEPGARLGPYEILSTIGAGGMGRVFKARDTRLGRIVAIKLLHPRRAADPELCRRLAREAQAISHLNHPNICTLYDVGEEAPSEGGSERSNPVDFLVMEYLEGETLAQRLTRGPLPIHDVLRYGAEMADALDRAHRAGITHRDVKPSNVMITKGGVKLLDFGLAKVRATTSSDSLDAAPATALTGEHVLVGTVQYMAPEQIDGSEIDARTDIFALAAVLYEMVAGRKAFEGETSASIMAAIARTEPPPLTSVADLPRPLEWVIRTCLSKEPDGRFQSAADVRHHLRAIAAGALTGNQQAATSRLGRRERLAWSLACTALLSVAVFLASRREPNGARPPSAPVVRFAVAPPEAHTFERPLAVSRDGRRIAFVALDGNNTSTLWERPLDSTAARRLAGTEGAAYPFWSPDGRYIGFFANRKLKKIDLSSGAIDSIADAASGGGGTWNNEGMILFSKASGSPSALWRVQAAGGIAKQVTHPSTDELILHAWPQFLPDGRQFIFTDFRRKKPSLYVGQLDSGERAKLLDFEWSRDAPRAWYASGFLFVVRLDGTVMAHPFAVDPARITGEPVQVIQGLEPETLGRVAFDVSDSGLMIYRARRLPRVAHLTWFERSGRQAGTLGDPGPYVAVAVSRDRRQVLAAREQTPNDFGGEIARLDVHSGTPTIVKVGAVSPVWSPEGDKFAFSGKDRAPFPAIANLDGTERTEPFVDFTRIGQARPTDWSADGRYIVGEVIQSETLADVWFVDLRNESTTIRYARRDAGNQRDPRLSPNGRWLAFASDETGTGYEVHVRAFPDGAGVWQISNRGGRSPRWSADGRELFYVDSAGTVMRVAVQTTPRFSASAPQPLFALPWLKRWGFGLFGAPYDVSSDGRFLVAVPAGDPTPAPLMTVLNWQQLLGLSSPQ